MDHAFFGYGSLVNRATHDYAAAHPATLTGWRRVWRHTALRPVAFLSAEPAEGVEIDGLIAEVPGGDWAALDRREHAYTRHTLPPATLRHPVPRPVAAQIYAVPAEAAAPPSERFPILLSYLDVVVQGFLAEFGTTGAGRFFATTGGWDAPILDDRASPRYPRAQRLSDAQTALVDAHLAALGSRIIAG